MIELTQGQSLQRGFNGDRGYDQIGVYEAALTHLIPNVDCQPAQSEGINLSTGGVSPRM